MEGQTMGEHNGWVEREPAQGFPLISSPDARKVQAALDRMLAAEGLRYPTQGASALQVLQQISQLVNGTEYSDSVVRRRVQRMVCDFALQFYCEDH